MTDDQKQLNALVVDDEQHARDNLAMLLETYCPEVRVIGTADGVEAARTWIEKQTPDVVFLDVRMPSGAEGFDLLSQVSQHKFMVVFVTAFRDYALEAFGANAVDYILKPVDPEELQAAVEKVRRQSAQLQKTDAGFSEYQKHLSDLLERLSGFQQQIAIHHARGVKLVRPSDILFVQAEGNCSNIALKDGARFLDTRTLKVYESLLPARHFIRVHRSYVVNLTEVDELIRGNGQWLRMKSGHKIPVSRSRLSAFLKAIDAA